MLREVQRERFTLELGSDAAPVAVHSGGTHGQLIIGCSEHMQNDQANFFNDIFFNFFVIL